MSKPILIFLGKDRCAHCKDFENEWKKLKSNSVLTLKNGSNIEGISNKVSFVKFHCDYKNAPPPCLKKYMFGYPTILLANPSSYESFYTKNGNYSKNWELNRDMDCLLFNYILVNGEYKLIGMPQTAENIATWVNNHYNDILINKPSQNIIENRLDTSFFA